MTAKVTEANGECLSVEATATLPSTTAAAAVGATMEGMALPSGGEGEETERDNAAAGGAPALEAPQTVMTTTEYVNSIDGEALVGDFVRAAEDMRDKMELDDREEGDDCSDAIMMSELRDFSSRCEILRDRGLLKNVGKKELIKTLSMLESVAKGAHETLIEMNDHSRGVNAQRVMKAMEAMAAYFVILSSADMPKEIYREESIDEMIECTRRQLLRNVFVFYDANLWNVHRGGDDNDDDDDDDDAEDDKRTVSGKKKTPASKTKANTSVVTPASATKASSNGRKVANVLGAKIGVVFTHLANLISILALPDATVLQLTSLAFSAFEIEDVSFVQLKSVDLVTSIFAQYSEHRGFIIDNVLSSLVKLPAESRGNQCFNVPEEDALQIQVLIALLMKCLQATVEFSDAEEPASDDKTTESGPTDVHAKAFGSAFHWTNYFWKDLLSRWPKVKAAENERQIRAVINNALVDALACRNLPEWPVANLLVLNLAGNLLGTLGLQCKDSKIREVALDFLGQTTSSLREDAKILEEDAFWRQLPRADDLDFTSNPDALHERAVLFAHQDAARVQTRVDAQDRNKNAIVANEETSEEFFALESILARYVAENNRGGASSAPDAMDETEDDDDDDDDDDDENHNTAASETSSLTRVTLHSSALAYHLCQFARDAEKAGEGFRQEVKAGGSRPMYVALHSAMRRVAETARGASRGSLAGLPRDLAKSLCLQLNARRPLARQLDVLVQRVTYMLDDSSVLVRTSATRAIGGMVSADPRLLESPDIVRALKTRMKDTGSSVRAAVVDVIGRQMVRNIALADKYYDVIEDRVSDVGVSVRKRVVSILQDCLRHPEFTKADKAMQVLAFRILDEEESIRQHVVKIFRELWFSPGALERDVDNDDDDDDNDAGSDDDDACAMQLATHNEAMTDAIDPISARASQIVGVSWDVYRLVSRSGRQKLPLLPTFPMVAILNAVLYPSEDEKLDSWVDVRGMRRIARRLAVQMLHALIECESDEAPPEVDARGALVAQDSSAAKSEVSKSVKYALGLHILTIVDPTLCLPKSDPTYFAVALQPYLKRVDDVSPHVGEKLQCCMSVIHVVACHAGRLPTKVANEIERDLRILLLRHHDKPVIYYACKTLCAVAETRGGRDSGTMSMLKRFVSIVIESISTSEPLTTQKRSHCARSLYVLGNIARFGADVIDAAMERGECDISMQDLLRVFRKTLEMQPAEEFDLTRGALGACGDLFVARPELMFNKDGGFGKGSFDPIMRAALASSAERSLKEQALTNLSELIREEEQRMTATSAVGTSTAVDDTSVSTKASVLKSAQKRARASEKLQIVNGQSDRSIAGGIAQRYWTDVLSLCVDADHGVRLKGIHLVEVVLRQGLVHPASAFPTLIALQIDPRQSVKRLARKLLKAQVHRHGEFFEHQLTHGVEQAYTFKKRLETAARRGENGSREASDTDGGFAFIYGLVNSSRTSRNAFLNTLLRRFETTSGSSDVLFLRFLAHVVTELPFTSVDETLYVVFQLNRVISLKGSLLLEHLKQGLSASSEQLDKDAPDEEFKRNVELAGALSVVLLLKSHVKRAYGLSDARVASYVPTEATRNAEVVKFDSSVTLETSVIDATASQSIAGARRAADTFRDLMTRDASDFAENMFKDSATKPGRRKRNAAKETEAEENAETPKRKVIVNDDDDDDDDDDDNDENDEAYLPALRSAGVATTVKKRRRATASKAKGKSPKKRLKF